VFGLTLIALPITKTAGDCGTCVIRLAPVAAGSARVRLRRYRLAGFACAL
jgi:hypothetical protein